MNLPYMKCIYIENELFGDYEKAMASDSYEEILKLFADDIKKEAIIVRAENIARGAHDLRPLKKEDVVSIGEESLVGKIVAIDPNILLDGYKSMVYQLYYVTGGNGAEANNRGNACFGYTLYNGERSRIERYQVLGIVPEDKLPDFAKQTLEKIINERALSRGER